MNGDSPGGDGAVGGQDTVTRLIGVMRGGLCGCSRGYSSGYSSGVG